jgi:hypothetical protein
MRSPVMKRNAVVSGVRGLARLRGNLPEVPPACSGEGHVTLEGSLSFLVELSSDSIMWYYAWDSRYSLLCSSHNVAV